jgi:hypothetical protein
MRSARSGRSGVTLSAPELVGHQEPRILSTPPKLSSSGSEAVELAALAGLELDPWQQLVLDHALGERSDGRWSSFEVGLIVSRQNGKGSILEARELAGLFLFNERLILHSAHEFKTAQEAFLRIRDLIDGRPEFRRRIKRVTNNTFEVGIELTTGQRLRFVARSGGSGRGFSGDLIVLDEAYNLPETVIDALMPTLSARPNPQIWYTSSAPDKDIAPCIPLARMRRRALAGGADALTYLEWSAEVCSDTCGAGCAEHDDPAVPATWAKANPALGIRITAEHVGREHESMGRTGFARERLGVGNYPSESGDLWSVIPEPVWRDLADAESQAGDPVAFAIDATPGGTHTAIGMAGLREDGLGHGELIDHRRGTGWVVERAVELKERWAPLPFVVDPRGPAGFLIPDLEAAGVEVTKTSAGDVGAATDGLIAACGAAEGDESTVRFRPHPALDAAVAGADTKPLGDGRKWDRRSPSTDISPLVAVTLARWGLTTFVEEEAAEPWVMFG